jgi:hypothetical protein
MLMIILFSMYDNVDSFPHFSFYVDSYKFALFLKEI